MNNNAISKNNNTYLQESAEFVRNEFMQKGDWYKALVTSILGYLQETDGSIPYNQMAVELANRIVGIEPDTVEDTEGGHEDTMNFERYIHG